MFPILYIDPTSLKVVGCSSMEDQPSPSLDPHVRVSQEDYEYILSCMEEHSFSFYLRNESIVRVPVLRGREDSLRCLQRCADRYLDSIRSNRIEHSGISLYSTNLVESLLLASVSGTGTTLVGDYYGKKIPVPIKKEHVPYLIEVVKEHDLDIITTECLLSDILAGPDLKIVVSSLVKLGIEIGEYHDTRSEKVICTVL